MEMYQEMHKWDEAIEVAEAKVIYYPPEVRSMKYCYLGVFRKEYFMLITK